MRITKEVQENKILKIQEIINPLSFKWNREKFEQIFFFEIFLEKFIRRFLFDLLHFEQSFSKVCNQKREIILSRNLSNNEDL